ncbi:hypothetical protein [Fulvivirga lutea]|uniref:Toxin n=1 Tax=Fulvivirga lutea TaxID=2810512 RepID=A0A974WG38_9BACT|nr:hypothetical protein [Fulvivirga lutea]QSE96502.1 hypothetical protein JR347_12945 [Fulvivirga lutea]
MATKSEVEQFLKEFKEKLKLTKVYFRDDRGKNAQTLADLEIRPIDREKTLLELEFEDYAEGPLEDTLYNKSDMWVFGKEIKDKEIYIKISIGFGEGGVICISFHIAERPMNYPFKGQQ